MVRIVGSVLAGGPACTPLVRTLLSLPGEPVTWRVAPTRGANMSTAILHTPLGSSQLDLSGLCGTCHQASGCAHLMQATSAIHQCEMFEVDGPPTFAFHDVRLVEIEPEPIIDPLADPPTAGLCINCDNRATCLLPQAVGGVWHCEEYR